ncbi:EamA family transporter [Streptomyces sp. NBC_01549]|uniref:DMT family transporter n=1 Tax=Streptomyces sp. NBC_01549 TaxID=2975874 RepID=UPI00224E71F5|nr:EamA family transporter [Streptomyces sp. NBC_01549]MCX4594562.1 EamA family transporter [Streptomyces sp. NBC_01549]
MKTLVRAHAHGADDWWAWAMSARITSPRFLALVGTVVLWASAFPAIRVGIDCLGVAALSLLRLLIAAVALLAVAPFAKVRLPRRGDPPLITLCGATGMTAYQVLLNWGEVHVEAGTASLLIAIAPVFSVLLGSLFLDERLTRSIVIGSVVGLTGAAVVSLAEGTSGFSVAALVILAPALVQGVYHFASKPLLRHRTGLEVATYAMVAGTVFALPLVPAAWQAAVHAPAAAAYLGLLPSALGFVIWAYAVARLPLAVSTAALYLVPPVALVVSFVWLAEVPRPIALVGGAISVASVILISRHKQSHSPTDVPAVDGAEPAAQQAATLPAPSR